MSRWDSASQIHSRVSNFKFDIGVGFINISCEIHNYKVLDKLWFRSKVFPGSLAHLSVWMGFCTSNLERGVKFQLRYWRVGTINISRKCSDGKVLANLGLKPKVLSELLTHLSAWAGFCDSSQQQGGKCKLQYWGMGCIHISCKIHNNVLDQLGIDSNVLPGHFSHLSAWVGFYTSRPQQGSKCKLFGSWFHKYSLYNL